MKLVCKGLQTFHDQTTFSYLRTPLVLGLLSLFMFNRQQFSLYPPAPQRSFSNHQAFSTPYTIEVSEDDEDANANTANLASPVVHPDDAATIRLKSAVTKRHGRIFSSASSPSDTLQAFSSVNLFEHLDSITCGSGHACQSASGGWNILLTGLHPETPEDDLKELLTEYGVLVQCRMPLETRTGFAQGWAVVEYQTAEGAANAIECLDGAKLMSRELKADWAFVLPPRDVDYEELEGLRNVHANVFKKKNTGGSMKTVATTMMEVDQLETTSVMNDDDKEPNKIIRRE